MAMTPLGLDLGPDPTLDSKRARRRIGECQAQLSIVRPRGLTGHRRRGTAASGARRPSSRILRRSTYQSARWPEARMKSPRTTAFALIAASSSERSLTPGDPTGQRECAESHPGGGYFTRLSAVGSKSVPYL